MLVILYVAHNTHFLVIYVSGAGAQDGESDALQHPSFSAPKAAVRNPSLSRGRHQNLNPKQKKDLIKPFSIERFEYLVTGPPNLQIARNQYVHPTKGSHGQVQSA